MCTQMGVGVCPNRNEHASISELGTACISVTIQCQQCYKQTQRAAPAAEDLLKEFLSRSS